ncbi:sugar phosphate isomerase/epimerase family protein [Rheinheimera marina]|uniref:Sugar phosphate isomerase/epimerase family protein n=1 Tax=Rheinheimera marina TaxID=1774958 RepID=A0ABV9JL89_9GAMM
MNNALSPPSLQDPSRRKLLKYSLLGLGTAALASPLSQAFAGSPAHKLQAGLQLYTVRDLMGQSVADTLKLVAGIGYKEVEFAGYFNLKAKEIRQILDSEGLTAPSAHVPLEVLQAQLDQVIEDAKIVGHHFIVLPYLTEPQRQTIDQYKSYAAFLNKAGEACKKAGLQMAYHNHDFEFQPINGQVPYDILLKETDADLVKLELDLFWTIKAGLSPLQLFERAPGRFAMWHVKDMSQKGDMVDVGTGVIDFAPIIAKGELAGVKHAFIEHDNSDNRVRTIKQGFDSLSKLLK